MPIDLIYSSTTGRLRRVVSPSGHNATHSGESILTISDQQYSSNAGLDALQALVTAASGKTPSGDRYASVDASGNVVSVHIACPNCGDIAPHADASLIANVTANPGDLLVAGGSKVLPNVPLTVMPPAGGTRLVRFRVRNDPLP